MKILIVIALCAAFAFNGCKEENIFTGSSTSSLYDPNITPQVIFTYPSDGTTGPFTNSYSSINTSQPHFKIQFNKIMSASTLNSTNVKITGFDDPVVVAGDFYDDGTTGLYKFQLRKTSSSDYYGSYIQYRIGKTYTVTVSPNVEDIHGNRLNKTYSFSFTTEPQFKVTAMYPKDSLKYSDFQVKVLFNSPVDTNIQSKISIAPAIAGTWYIDSYESYVVRFSPSAAFSPNTNYTVTIAGSAKDVFGNTIDKSYDYSFKSGIFQMVSSSPSLNSTNVPLSTNLYFTFNTSVNLASLQSGFSIQPNVNGTFSNYSNTFYFSPAEPLQEKTNYTVTLTSGIKSSSGLALQIPATVSFITEGFKISQIHPYYSSAISRFTNIEISFNTKVDTSTVSSAFSISPVVQGRLYYSNKNRIMTFRPDSALQPKTQYSVIIGSTMKSAAGNLLEGSQSFSFTTGD